MSSILPSIMPYNEVMTKGACRSLTLIWKITAAVTVSPRPIAAGPAAMVVFGAIAAQATIDDFLGTTNEFLIAAFDATAMGADAMGVIINMKGQAADLIGVETVCGSETAYATIVNRVALKSATTLTASTLVTEAALGASGNIAYKINWGNTPDFDALTDGYIRSTIYFIAK